MAAPDPHRVTSQEALRAFYPDLPGDTSLAKEVDHVHALYRPFIEASPFVVLGTRGAEGLDSSPRGDAPGFVQIADERTLLLPDRRGNNRIDSLRNVVAHPEVSLLFLVPGCNETLRVMGRAHVSVAPDLLARCAHDGIAPRSVLVIAVDKVFFQCGRALIRSGLWEEAVRIDRASLPSVGRILQTLGAERIDGAAYDRELPGRQRRTLY
ncbi:MAG: pyridoxamine 5'-phosphate oxidase family protein [Variovorax sp.]|nr:pyridoxamine 5'-phosphate oxidase family protein [Variovorax sp.]